MCSEYLFLTSETVFLLIIISLSGGVFSIIKYLNRILYQLRFTCSLEDIYLFSKAYQAFEYYRMISIIMSFLGVWVFGLGFWLFFILLFFYLLYIEFNIRRFMNYFYFVVLFCLVFIGFALVSLWLGCFLYNFTQVYLTIDSSELIIDIKGGMQVYLSGGEKSAYKCFSALRAAANTSMRSEVLSWCLHRAVNGSDGSSVAFFLNKFLPQIHSEIHPEGERIAQANSIIETYDLGQPIKDHEKKNKAIYASTVILSHNFGKGADLAMSGKSGESVWAKYNLINYKHPFKRVEQMQIQETLVGMYSSKFLGFSKISRPDACYQGDFVAEVQGLKVACEIKTADSSMHLGKVEGYLKKYQWGKILSDLSLGVKPLLLIDASSYTSAEAIKIFNLRLVDQFKSFDFPYKGLASLLHSPADILELDNKLGVLVIHPSEIGELPCPVLEGDDVFKAEEFERVTKEEWEQFEKKQLIQDCLHRPSSIVKKLSIDMVEAVKKLNKE